VDEEVETSWSFTPPSGAIWTALQRPDTSNNSK
jgi:hypothetical protein